jgi:hypothetical protein
MRRSRQAAAYRDRHSTPDTTGAANGGPDSALASPSPAPRRVETRPGGPPQWARCGRRGRRPRGAPPLLAAGARDERHLELLKTIGMRSVAIVPFAGRRRSGAMTVITAITARAFGDDDVAFACDLGSRACDPGRDRRSLGRLPGRPGHCFQRAVAAITAGEARHVGAFCRDVPLHAAVSDETRRSDASRTRLLTGHPGQGLTRYAAGGVGRTRITIRLSPRFQAENEGRHVTDDARKNRR